MSYIQQSNPNSPLPDSIQSPMLSLIPEHPRGPNLTHSGEPSQ
jgi:hypothetical protein